MIRSVLFIYSIFVFGGDHQRERLLVNGFDFQKDAINFTMSIHKVDFNGSYVAISANENQGVYLYTKELKYLREIGKKGEGPSEIGTHTIPSFSLSQEEMWIVESNKRFLKGFSLDGTHLKNIRIKRYMPFPIQTGTNSFIVGDNFIILPTLNDNIIGYKYSKETGEVINDFDFPLELNQKIYSNAPWYYNSSWFKDGSYFYVAFPHQPVILKLSEDLKVLDIFHIEIQEAVEMHADIYDRYQERTSSQMPMGMPIVFDVRFTNEKIYVLLPTTLVALNKQNGKIEGEYKFYGTEKDVGFEASGLDLVFTSFYPQQRDLILFHEALMWNKEAWRAKLP